MVKKARKPTMSDSHKAALAAGRDQGRAVRRYLEAIETSKPRRGRRRTSESIQKRLATIDEKFANADPLTRLHLAQERMDLEHEAAALGDGGPDLSTLEEDFVAAAASYSERKGLSYSAWRAAGVQSSVLQRAGISRSS